MDDYDENPLMMTYPPDILLGRMEQVRVLVQDMDKDMHPEQYYFLEKAALLFFNRRTS